MITAEQIIARLEAEATKVSRETCSRPPLDNTSKLVHMTGQVAGLERAVSCINEMLASDRKLEDTDDDDDNSARGRFSAQPAVDRRPAPNPLSRGRVSGNTSR